MLNSDDKIYLSVDSYKFALARANTSQGKTYLKYLIDVERQYRKQLERNVAFLVADEQRPSEVPDSTLFIFPASQVHQWSGYASLTYTIKVIKEDYTEDVDYRIVDSQPMLNADAVLILLNAARPAIGCTTIPEELKQYKYPWDKAQQNRLNKINRRRSQKPIIDCNSEQLSLF
jgi:hypothetical protein